MRAGGHIHRADQQQRPPVRAGLLEPGHLVEVDLPARHWRTRIPRAATGTFEPNPFSALAVACRSVRVARPLRYRRTGSPSAGRPGSPAGPVRPAGRWPGARRRCEPSRLARRPPAVGPPRLARAGATPIRQAAHSSPRPRCPTPRRSGDFPGPAGAAAPRRCRRCGSRRPARRIATLAGSSVNCTSEMLQRSMESLRRGNTPGATMSPLVLGRGV